MKKTALIAIFVVGFAGNLQAEDTRRSSGGGMLGGNIGTVLKAAESVQYVDQLTADIPNVLPQLQKTANYLAQLAKALKKDGEAYRSAKDSGNEEAKLAAQQAFIKDLTYMKAIGGFVKFISYIFEDIEKIVQLSPKAAGPVKQIKEKILEIRASLAPIWEIPKEIVKGEGLKTNPAAEKQAEELSDVSF